METLELLTTYPVAALGLAASRARNEEDDIQMRRGMATTSDTARRRGSAQPLVRRWVAAAGGHLRRHSSLMYRVHLYTGVVVPGSWPPGARNAAHAVCC